jgi:hypothetical protein
MRVMKASRALSSSTRVLRAIRIISATSVTITKCIPSHTHTPPPTHTHTYFFYFFLLFLSL